ncbi:MAG: alpha/beta hydrolase [Prolixibacteraceae bacterium]|nr:alpha/beta hydrolase [Prolixibacteraceae bacterium]
MASLKSKLLIGILRHRHILKGRLKKERMGFGIEEVLAFRETCEKGAARMGKLPGGISIRQELLNMVLSEWIIPEKAPDGKLIFYVHGGGYVSGSCNDHRAVVAKIATKTQITALLYEYGLAPENPFPASINDSINVYQTVLEKGYLPENIVMMGESAGGGLCLALLQALRDKNIPFPKAAVAIQPWTDLSCSGASYKTKNKLSLAPLNCWNVFSHYYVGKNDVRNPYISPLFGNLTGLPPIYINVGDSDELYDDSIRFFEKAKQAGADIILKEGRGMIHCYPLLAPLFREATEAMDEIAKFVTTNLKE